jgi:hypothetical protein
VIFRILKEELEFLEGTGLETSCKALRPYQARLVTDVCRATGDVLVEQPTGSGKTMQIVTLVAMHLGRRFTHAVISAPQEQIEHGFVHRDYQRVDWSRHDGVAVPSVEVPKEMIWPARGSSLGSVRHIRSYLRLPGPLDHALACTHAALNLLTAAHLPSDLSGKALFIDEAHHASADGLSQIVSLWRERGGQLFFFTATPYRGDGRPVALEGMRLFRRSLAEHMAEGFAPGHLDSEIVALGNPGDSITAGQFTGEDAPPPSYFDGLVNAICRKWVEDAKPKAIVRVPPMRGGSEGLVARLIQALSSHGARVLNATGIEAKDKQRFLAALQSEKNRSFPESKYDIIVGIQRVLEGTDWPVCSAVYCVGMPGSLNTVVQLLGRAMRLKGDGYPSPHRDRARLVFFVPCGGGSALADLSLNHSRHALLTCCFLADHEVGQEWIVLREVRRGIEDALGPRAENPAAADAENEADSPLDAEVRAEIELVMANAREQIISEGGEPTLGEVMQLVTKTRPDLPEVALHRVAAEILASQPGSVGETVREVIHKEVVKRLRIDPMVKQAMEGAFALVLDEFRAVTLEKSTVLESVGRQVHGVTGGQMRQFAQRLREAAPRLLTEEQILVWADAQHETTGEWPKSQSGVVAAAPEENWANLEQLLQRGLRGLPGGSSLARLLEERRGVRNRGALSPLTPEQILSWADAHFERTGRWPTLNSGSIPDTCGETWAAAHAALREGGRGLPGGSSLAKLLADHRGVRNIQDLPPITIEIILTWADEHFKQTGEWPTQQSGAISGAQGETWKGVQMALLKGRRGLPGRSSIARLLAEKRGIKHPREVTRLTEEQILAWADEHFKRTGHWPTVDAGPVLADPQITWRIIEGALRRGQRGLRGGSTLARLLAERLGARNRSDLPRLTVEQILSWADAHLARTGQWPNARSGLLEGTAGETWRNVNAALLQGLRGLAGNFSLAQLLAEQRGVRNHKALPHLTTEQILAWANTYHQRTGHWPKKDSGEILDHPMETWRNIDQALVKGLRGLPGGFSLAQLLAQEYGVRNHMALAPLTIEQILVWADAHFKRTGLWPRANSGEIIGSVGETWSGVNTALIRGSRGLPGSLSLVRLIKEYRESSVS